MSPEAFATESAALLHAIQTGVAYEIAKDPHSVEPKHLRVGVNNALLEGAAVAKLLIDKGIITESEYFASVIDRLREEKARYEEKLSRLYGATITLG